MCGRGARDARVRFTDEEEPDGVFCEARAVREGSRVRVCVVARRPERDLQKPQSGRGRKSRDKAKSARFLGSFLGSRGRVRSAIIFFFLRANQDIGEDSLSSKVGDVWR